jgi:hypothetical protein
LSRACRVTQLGSARMSFSTSLLARVLNESSLSTHFIAPLKFELNYLSSTHKRASLEILKLDSARLDYISTHISKKFEHSKRYGFTRPTYLGQRRQPMMQDSLGLHSPHLLGCPNFTKKLWQPNKRKSQSGPATIYVELFELDST